MKSIILRIKLRITNFSLQKKFYRKENQRFFEALEERSRAKILKLFLILSIFFIGSVNSMENQKEKLNKRYMKEISDLRAKIKNNLNEVICYNYRPIAHSKREKYKIKREKYEKAEKDHSKGKAYKINKREKYLKAKKDYFDAIKLDQTCAVVYSNLGYAFLKLKGYEEALAAYDKAIEFDPQSGRYYYHRGNALYKLKRYYDALIAYNEAIKLDPNCKINQKRLAIISRKLVKNAKCYYEHVTALEKQKKWGEALLICNKAIECDFTYAIFYKGKHDILVKLGRDKEALITCGKAIKLDPRNPIYRMDRGTIYFKLEQYARAKKDLTTAKELDPENFELKNFIDRVDRRMKLQKNIEKLEKQIEQ